MASLNAPLWRLNLNGRTVSGGSSLLLLYWCIGHCVELSIKARRVPVVVFVVSWLCLWAFFLGWQLYLNVAAAFVNDGYCTPSYNNKRSCLSTLSMLTELGHGSEIDMWRSWCPFGMEQSHTWQYLSPSGSMYGHERLWDVCPKSDLYLAASQTHNQFTSLARHKD